ncbi:putative bifunctional diguanylate cyclase/phosphodiesterase [Methylobacterium sp. PvR107]|uniref:putative bifunctional diguanylate cyclase/phosphodiesterase n=1 Tax=Methylobacterium sp. PvR107 TaxID=2806597 RepID=UPI001AE86EF3|nr:bifunctional diguanylate cyclase/phosphodiesterase [Methylobacterium sp. PvR107]MBP1181051.1 diguanylate cyclase (GGDEF)-like protein [Methylobacterium sp. PvR107]
MSIERAPGPKRSAETSQAAGPAAPGNAAGSLIDRVRRLDAVAALPRRYRLQVRAGLLEETLKLATYSAVTHLIIAAAVAYFFWTSAPQAYLLGLLAWVAVVIVAATYLTWRYLRTYASAVSPAGVRWGCRISGGLALALGLAWATMPVVLFAPADGDQRLIIVATVAGLISDAYVVGPLLSVSYLFAIPVILGSFVGLARCGEPVALSIGFLLVVYAIFVVVSVSRMSRLSRQRILDRVRVEEQSETIGLLLNEFEAGASDWLWETDATGHFQHVSTRMAEVLGCPVALLQHGAFEALLSGRGEAPPEADHSAELRDHLRQGRAFHEHLIAFRTPAGQRWLQLSGKPFLDQRGSFAGFRGVGSDVTQSREAEAHIAYLATRDALTGLSNRVVFHEVASEACAAAVSKAQGAPVSLLYLDLDGFKTVNDSAGHTTGDALLCQVGERLRVLLPADAQAFRLGGDEFAILHRGRDPAAAEALAEAAIRALCAPYSIDGVRAEIGVSIGIASAPGDAADPADLLRKADLALYSAKDAGKGRWKRFDRNLERRVQRWRELDEAMRAGLENGEMELHYQPLVSLQDGQVVGCEALLRWTRPGHGAVSPAEMIPIAESTGFVITIGRWALRLACAEALTWPAQMCVAVNISSIHFRLPDFFADVEAVLTETGLAPERLEIEITESIFLANTPHVLDNLRALRALGVRIALDDFGTGYSSLSYLTQFPVDKIKIDRAFVRDLSSRPECLTVIEAIMVIARDLHIDVTVEGVETEQQAALLRSRRCNSAQGFLYSPARPPGEVPGLVERIPRVALQAEQAVRAVA